MAHLASVEVAYYPSCRLWLRPLQFDSHQRRVGRQPPLLLGLVAPAATQDEESVRANPLGLPSAAAAAREKLEVRGVSIVMKELQILDQVPLEISGHREPAVRSETVQ